MELMTLDAQVVGSSNKKYPTLGVVGKRHYQKRLLIFRNRNMMEPNDIQLNMHYEGPSFPLLGE
jgi:hypothetical protein